MMEPETKLLLDALLYEEGHPRRTQHILKVYALAKLLGECAGLGEEERRILQAAAILHDIPIKYCKEHDQGDACQANQQKEAPRLVQAFLQRAGYAPVYRTPVLELVMNHHCYTAPRSQLLQLLIEADLIVNAYETPLSEERWAEFQNLFRSDAGKALFSLQAQNEKVKNFESARKTY